MVESAKRILIVGDGCIDVDVHGVCERYAQESAGCPVLRETRRLMRPGMATAVAAMVRGLGAQPIVVTGMDQSVKTRFLVEGHQVWRHDSDARPLAAVAAADLADRVAAEVLHADAVLVADYGKGVCCYPVIRAAIDGAQQKGIPCLVDPAHGVDWRTYRHATAIKANRSEWDHAFAMPGNARWWEQHVENVIVTEGARGMTHYAKGKSAVDYRGRPTQLVDATGAGDMALAAIGVSLARGLDWSAAIAVANVAASLKVERRGAVPVPLDEILAVLGQ